MGILKYLGPHPGLAMSFGITMHRCWDAPLRRVRNSGCRPQKEEREQAINSPLKLSSSSFVGPVTAKETLVLCRESKRGMRSYKKYLWRYEPNLS